MDGGEEMMMYLRHHKVTPTKLNTKNKVVTKGSRLPLQSHSPTPVLHIAKLTTKAS